MLADYSLIIARRKMRSSIMVDDPVRMVAGRAAVGDTMIGYQSSAAIPGCKCASLEALGVGLVDCWASTAQARRGSQHPGRRSCIWLAADAIGC